MTGIIGKLLRNLTGSLNDLVDNTSNTGVEARQIVRDLGEKIAATEKSYIDVKATYVLLQNNLKDAQAESDSWKQNAQKAVDKKDDDLARQCLDKKHGFDSQAKSYQNQIDVMKPQVDLLEHQLDALKEKHEEMGNQTDLLAARSDTAKAQQKAGQIISSIASDDLTSDFSTLEKNVSKDEARAQAVMGIADKASGKDLTDSLAALDKKQTIDDELASMKSGSTTDKAA